MHSSVPTLLSLPLLNFPPHSYLFHSHSFNSLINGSLSTSACSVNIPYRAATGSSWVPGSSLPTWLLPYCCKGSGSGWAIRFTMKTTAVGTSWLASSLAGLGPRDCCFGSYSWFGPNEVYGFDFLYLIIRILLIITCFGMRLGGGRTSQDSREIILFSLG